MSKEHSVSWLISVVVRTHINSHFSDTMGLTLSIVIISYYVRIMHFTCSLLSLDLSANNDKLTNY